MTDSNAFTVKDRRKHGFFIVYNELVRRDAKLLGVNGIAVYCLLASFADNDTNSAFPSVATIAGVLGISPTTVKKAIKDLEKTGWIKKENRQADGKRNYHSNMYFLLDVPIQDKAKNTNPQSPDDQPHSHQMTNPQSPDDVGGWSADDHEQYSYTELDLNQQNSRGLNPKNQTPPLPPAGGTPDGGTADAVWADGCSKPRKQNNSGVKKQTRTQHPKDNIFEFVLKAVYGITYTPGKKLSKAVQGHTNGIAGALRDVDATPEECAKALSWHTAGRDDKRGKLSKPGGAPQWAKMIADYRESDAAPSQSLTSTCLNCGEKFTTASRFARFCSAECEGVYYADSPSPWMGEQQEAVQA